ncbi:hypothetical protein OG585_44685 [Streptomyces sp. NBC_01340]|nr:MULTISPECIES: hypothetical protein [unclassified Streptomyces]MCX4459830.1 hypothetical protein [Streptomyces sp. NBC_01719]MCX4499188.1 hypothetical protein [Streptomyces sp. NBC_01728]WSI43600.1 hypothetical protein OG585_44685 [Streptomyces sp. NBC_01340]
MSSHYVSGRGWIRTNISESGGASTPFASGKGAYHLAVHEV